MSRDYFRVGQKVRCKKDLWQNPNQIVVVVKRKKNRWGWSEMYRYFVCVPGAPAGQGAWMEQQHLIKLTPLEELALAAE